MSPTDIFLSGAVLTLIILLLTPRIHRDVAAKAQRRREQDEAAKKPTGAWDASKLPPPEPPDPNDPVDPRAYDADLGTH